MYDRVVLDYVEFHITNVCNFNCIGCNKLNNYSFIGGIQKWHEYAKTYTDWAKRIDVKRFAIIGGEPMTNPDYLIWLENIANLWPNARGQLTTNGHYLKPDNKDLYNILKNHSGCFIKISAHNPNKIQEILGTVKKFLVEPIIIKRVPENLTDLDNFTENWKKNYNNIRGSSWPDCDTVEEWYNLPENIKNECEQDFNFSPEILAQELRHYLLVDVNGVTVSVENNTHFHQASVIQISDQSFKLHNSDVDTAHNICDAKKCHQFFKGKLHKCYLTSLLPEFDQQFLIEMDDADRKLLMSYEPLTLNHSDDQIKQFIDNIKNSIPQCKFCPEEYESKLTMAEHGNKIKIIKKKFL